MFVHRNEILKFAHGPRMKVGTYIVPYIDIGLGTPSQDVNYNTELGEETDM